MLNEEICRLREKLNNSILNEADYSITYQISVELDELIAQYYSSQMQLVGKTKVKHTKRVKQINGKSQKELAVSK